MRDALFAIGVSTCTVQAAGSILRYVSIEIALLLNSTCCNAGGLWCRGCYMLKVVISKPTSGETIVIMTVQVGETARETSGEAASEGSQSGSTSTPTDWQHIK